MVGAMKERFCRARSATGPADCDLTAYGLARAPQGYQSRFRQTSISPAVDDGFVAALKAGRARVVGPVERLDGADAVLASGDRVAVDTIVCATGYGRGLERLVGHLGVLAADGAPVYRDGAPSHPDTPGLYFAGFLPALSGAFRPMARHAKRLAAAVHSDQRTSWRRSPRRVDSRRRRAS